MALTPTCDLCGELAIDEVEMKSKKTTAVKLDVCEFHQKVYKRFSQAFSNKDTWREPAVVKFWEMEIEKVTTDIVKEEE